MEIAISRSSFLRRVDIMHSSHELLGRIFGYIARRATVKTRRSDQASQSYIKLTRIKFVEYSARNNKFVWQNDPQINVPEYFFPGKKVFIRNKN